MRHWAAWRHRDPVGRCRPAPGQSCIVRRDAYTIKPGPSDRTVRHTDSLESDHKESRVTESLPRRRRTARARRGLARSRPRSSRRPARHPGTRPQPLSAGVSGPAVNASHESRWASLYVQRDAKE
eukprot:723322-Hanusia_phi.AAC.1